MTPEEIAADVVKAFSGDEYWIDVDMAIIAIAAALRTYGDERAQAITDAYEQSAAFKIGSAIVNAKERS